MNVLDDKRHPRSFFLVEREQLVRGLLNLRTQICGYLGSRCDCKYGVRELPIEREAGEQQHAAFLNREENGCPEALSAATILSVMTDAEYEALAKRAGCFWVE